ncbi:ankyrin repeat domain-containing protein 50 [Ricinus communis]|uniref:ankyrin repeat domain-containing protein 50 n=1 Tax=Ricinus communis TaxID=3988 RepID=UPI00201B2A7B|nr:ankyrin repeat domain-containing protein 50 [Ricinus communis]
MTVFYGKQVVPVDYEAEVSQRLLEASLAGDLRSALECIADEFVDVNFVGAVWLKCRKSEVVLRDESPSEVVFDYEEFKTDVTALFLAVHSGNVALIKKLLSVGADVNQKLFRGFATTAAVREGRLEILEILLKAGASQPACEEALLEASCHGQARLVELLMSSDLIRPHVAVHALVTACCRGFVDVVDTLAKCGVDVNTTDRLLLLSSKPSLHTNVDCPALVAAVVSRQVAVVHTLLKVGARMNVKVRLGAWSWDTNTGEEFRVGAGLAEPYAITWLAVEYFEITGAILCMLLQHFSPNTAHHGRTLLHHAILCGNAGAIKVLLSCGANVESPVKTQKTEFRPIHMAARLGLATVLQCLTDSGCDLNSRTDTGDTALMISAKYRQEECLQVLAMAGADFGLVNVAGQTVHSLATNMWSHSFQQAVLDVINSGKVPKSSNFAVFCPLIFVAQTGDTEALKVLIDLGEINLDYQDDNGFSAVMFAAIKGHVEAFRLLVYAGADVKLFNKAGETAITLSKLNQHHDLFEKVMLEFAIQKGNRNAGGFYALHCAARHGDMDAVKLLSSRGYDVNLPDADGYTPLMLAAKEGRGSTCKLLISCGANCEFKNPSGETALSLARKKYGGRKNDAEHVILDELARKLVLGGSYVQKHTKRGKGAPHRKEIVMVGDRGVLRWGKSRRRNVICREAEVGASPSFERNRRNRGDADIPGIFRVLTTKNKELHFVCNGGSEMAELWVRGIKLVTREAICV